YDRSDAAPVTVKYQDSEGNQLAEPSILSGKVGLPYESEAKEIPGWYVTETPDNASGTFTEDPQEVVYVYDRSDAAPVTVRYVDTEGNQLSEPSILSGKVGLPYESEAKEIPGWYVTETPVNASGTFTEDPQEVVYVYDRSDAAPVTVKYQNSEGNQLAEPSILSGKVGLPYESEAKEIPGWYVTETPVNASGTFTEEPQEVVYVYDRSDAAPVTVKYQDTEGNQLSEPSILSGKVGLSYESEAKEIPGWYVTETPVNASGTFTEEPQEVVYVYDRSDAAPVTVKYQDYEGNQLAEPSILSGKVGLPYESEAKEIPGWYVTETPDNASGTFTEEPQEVVYVYDRSDAAPVTVRYVDTEGNQLSEPSILSGKVGLPYESEAKEIPGWYVTETPDNASGTFTEEPQEVVYVYDRSDAAPVTVKYQDSEGNQLAEPSILSGKVGLPYESEAKEIPGWYVTETPDNASGTFTEDPQEVVYVYDRSDAAPVTVKYQDSEGNQLAEPSILSGKVGLPYESESKEIRGWYVIETPDNASGTFTEDPQEVVYVYDRSDAAPVTVKYQDSEGNQLAEPSILSGKVGLPYESEAKEIPGWYVLETPDNASGTFTEEPQEAVYVYDRSDAAPITVRYVDTEGNQLSEPSILSGKVGLPYESEAKEIPGWHLTGIPDNSSGIFTENPQEVVYIYVINKVDSEQDNSDNDLSTDNNFSDSNKKLPNTGESLIGQVSMVLAGSLIVMGIFVFVVRKRKKDKD
ncbi:MucBP domain-containing protein, partial [Enterococcus entomosocium]|uniref:MucBP domain-containing protein n=1 Tax=Enterococcus entomosocium TaxID=3034352 RepID=UPI002648BB56